MERQKAEARANWAGSGEAATETVWFGVKDRVGATEFLGYETEHAEGVVTALVKSGRRSSAEPGDEIAVVVNQTPFYGESGGQQGDTGAITGEGRLGSRASTRRKSAATSSIHIATVTEAQSSVGDALRTAHVDHERRRTPSAPTIRRPIFCMKRCAMCSATMLRRKARLWRPTGCASTSLIPSRSPTRRSAEVETMANEIILQNAPVTTRLMAVDDAIAEGAMALVRRKIRRGGSRRVDGHGDHGDKAAIDLLDGTVRRHACAPDWRYRPGPHRGRRRGCVGRAPPGGAWPATRAPDLAAESRRMRRLAGTAQNHASEVLARGGGPD